MIIKECAYCNSEKQTCNLFPKYYDQIGNYRFVPCENIPIANCPYKLFMCGKIDKEELNKRIMEIQKERTTNE